MFERFGVAFGNAPVVPGAPTTRPPRRWAASTVSGWPSPPESSGWAW